MEGHSKLNLELYIFNLKNKDVVRKMKTDFFIQGYKNGRLGSHAIAKTSTYFVVFLTKVMEIQSICTRESNF